jgi:uncharacterized BrkB/YihY/UPF0761 family membrane protein
MSWRRAASARPPAGGVVRSIGHGLQVGRRARELGRALLDGFKQHDLLTYSSAISFQIVTAVVPFVMFVLALAGLLHLNSVWQDHVAPEIRTHVSAADESVFGGLASVIVVIAYLYISTTAFLFGAQLDGIIRAQATGTLSGVEVDPPMPP